MRAAVFGAQQVILAGTIGRERKGGVTAGDDVLLHPQRRGVEAVDHILRRHDEPHRPSQRQVQFVYFATALRILEALRVKDREVRRF